MKQAERIIKINQIKLDFYSSPCTLISQKLIKDFNPHKLRKKNREYPSRHYGNRFWNRISRAEYWTKYWQTEQHVNYKVVSQQIKL